MLIMVLGIISLAVGIGSLVCWILEIVAAFQNGDGPLMGILSIVLCGLGGFIIGWIHNAQWGITNIMMIWSGLIVVNILISVVTTVMGASM